MAIYTISDTGGLFTATSSWVDGVVPPNQVVASVNNDIIIGITSSGPLTFNNLGTRNIPSLNLFDYANTISLTGSNTLQLYGYTNSFSPSMTWQYQTVGSSIVRFYTTGATTSPSVYQFRGCSFSGNTFVFHRQGASPIHILDEFVITATSSLDIRWRNDTWYDTISGTIGIPATIRIQMSNSNDALTFVDVGRGNPNTRGNRINVFMNQGRVNFGQTPGVAPGVILIQNGASTNQGNQLSLGRWGGYKYISGTIGRPLNFLLLTGGSETNDVAIQGSVEFDSVPGATFGLIQLQHGRGFNTANANFTHSVILGSGFSCRHFLFGGSEGSSPLSWHIVGTGSNIHMGDTFIGYGYISRGPNANSEYVENYLNNRISFLPGPTYSFERLLIKGPFFNEYGNQVYNPVGAQRIISPMATIRSSGTSSVSFRLLRNQSYASGVSFSNINVEGFNLYAFGSTWSNSTGILGEFPTGGGGGTAGETSYTFVS